MKDKTTIWNDIACALLIAGMGCAIMWFGTV